MQQRKSQRLHADLGSRQLGQHRYLKVLTSSLIARSRAHGASAPSIEAAPRQAHSWARPDHTVLLAGALPLLSSWKRRRLVKVKEPVVHIPSATGQQHGDQVGQALWRKLLTPPHKLLNCCAREMDRIESLGEA